jgi:hypothetical protein
MALQGQLFATLHNEQKAKGVYLAGLAELLILPNTLALMGKKCMFRYAATVGRRDC